MVVDQSAEARKLHELLGNFADYDTVLTAPECAVGGCNFGMEERMRTILYFLCILRCFFVIHVLQATV